MEASGKKRVTMDSSLDKLVSKEETIIKDIFRKWDEDGNGTIERSELASVMFEIAPSMTKEDVDVLLGLIDTDGNGTISFGEFVDWLTDPTSRTTIGVDGWLVEDLHIEDVFRPLFNVFDPKGTGVISLKDFHEFSAIITNSIKMHPMSKNEQPLGLLIDKVDEHADRPVTFDDFVKWHCQILKEAGIPIAHVKAIVSDMAESLEAIFDIQKKKQNGLSTNETLPALQGAVKKLSDVSTRLYTAKKNLLIHGHDPSEHQDGAPPQKINSWKDPPTKAIVALIRTCAKEQGLLLQMKDQANEVGKEPSSEVVRKKSSLGGRRRSNGPKTDKITLLVGSVRLIVPEVLEGDAQEQKEQKKFYAQVARKGAGDDEDNFYYKLTPSPFAVGGYSCKLLEDKKDLMKAFSAFLPELQLFALLKSQALMDRASGHRMGWSGVEAALGWAVDMGLMSEADEVLYYEDMHQSVMEQIVENEGQHEVLDMGLTVSQVASAQLDKLQLSPIDVLAGLSNLGLVKVSDAVWAQILSKNIAQSMPDDA